MENIHLPELTSFYVNTSLYVEYQITAENAYDAYGILYPSTDVNMDCYCIDCGKQSIFKYSRGSQMFEFWEVSRIVNGNVFDELKKLEGVYGRQFQCSRSNKHKLEFIIEINNGTFQKIGQIPSLADIEEHRVIRYKKVLKEYYPELTKAIGLHAHGVGVGAFAYLRRIIENFIIKPAYEEAKSSNGFNDEIYQRSRVKERIKILDKYLPETLKKTPEVYSLISKGLHELSEDECRLYFPLVLKLLEYVLDEVQSKRELEEKKKEIHKAISQATGKRK